MNAVVALHRSIKVLLDDARSVKTRSWFTQPLRVVQVPNPRLPFEVNMHDDAVLSLWKEHRGVERPGADLDAQWDRRIIKPMQYVLENETPEEVSSTFADGKMTLTASARPHSACALLAYLANLADANPYPYVGLSCKYPCYAC